METKKTIGVDELQDKLNRNERVFILDVRPADQRNEWKIAGSVHVDGYQRLNNGDYSVLQEINIPADADLVVTVCAAGRTSLIAAEGLRKSGIPVYSLEGGMKAWNYAWNTAEMVLADGTTIVQVRRPAKGVLSYVVGSRDEAVVIDAALDPVVYEGIAREKGWRIKYVTDTHIHADFVSRTGDLARSAGAEHVLLDKSKPPVTSGDFIRFGSTKLEVIHTPGHTWESTSFRLSDEALFTGDTLFVDGIGRPDLKADQQETIDKSRSLHASLRKLLSLGPSALVLPAHSSGTIPFDGAMVGERMPRIKEKVDALDLDEDDFVRYTLSKIPAPPPNYITISGINRKGSHEGHDLATLEGGGNFCSIS